jgi:hypothetical protein
VKQLQDRPVRSRICAVMTPESTARNLADCVDALAAALRAAGVPHEQSSALLASAATATMHAVMLDALLDEAQPAAAAAPVVPLPVERPTQLAA